MTSMRFHHKATAAGLSAVLLFLSAATPMAQAGFWEERQRAGSKKDLPSSPLASLTQALPSADRVLNGFAAVDPSLIRRTSSRKTIPSWMLPLATPFAEVEDFSMARNPSEEHPFVVLVQDVHGLVEAQRNMSALLSSISRSYALRVVGVEGAAGGFRHGVWRRVSRAEDLSFAADHLLGAKLIGGAEHFALTNPEEPALWGVESDSSYDANVEAYRALVPFRSAVAGYRSALAASLETVRLKALGPELSALEARVRGYAEGKLGLGEYLSSLFSAAGAPSRAFPQVEIFLKAYGMEKSIDFRAATVERSRLAETLTRTLDTKGLENLVAASLEHRSGKLSTGEYYGYLKSLASRLGAPIDRTPAFRAYVEYALVADRIRKDALFDEISVLEKNAGDRLALSAEQREALSLMRDARLLDKLFTQSMTPQDWAIWTSRRPAVERLNDRMASLGFDLPRLSFPADLSLYERFYTAALARNADLLGNFMAKVGRGGASQGRPAIAVLVSGGFHTSGLRDLLARQGVSYAVLTPRLTSVDGAADYLEVFSRSATPLEKMLLGRAVFMQSQRPLAGKPSKTQPHVAETVSKAAAILLIGGSLLAKMASGAPITLEDAERSTVAHREIAALRAEFVEPAGRGASVGLSLGEASVEMDFSPGGKVDPASPLSFEKNGVAVSVRPVSAGVAGRAKAWARRGTAAVLGGAGMLQLESFAALFGKGAAAQDGSAEFASSIFPYFAASLVLGLAVFAAYLFWRMRGSNAVTVTPQEAALAEAYWKGELKTTPIERPFRASRREDVSDVEAIGDRDAFELERLAVESLARGEGVIAILGAGASSRMNTAEAPEEVREMVGGKEILSKAAVPVGVNEEGNPVTYLGAFGSNVSRLLNAVDVEASAAGRSSLAKFNLVLMLSNDGYRAEHDRLLWENESFGLPYGVEFYHQPLGAKFVGTQQDVDKLKSKFKDEKAYQEASAVSEKAFTRYQAGDRTALVLPGERDPWGHGEALHQLVVSGQLLGILSDGRKWISFRNIDNVAAKYDKTWLVSLGRFLKEGLDMQPEVSRRSPGQKGGSLIVMEDNGMHQLAEDPNIQETNKVKGTSINPGDSYWFNDAVAIFSPRFIADLYRREGQPMEDFLAELRAADESALQEIADRGRRKFPKIIDPKPAKAVNAVAVKVETNMWQSSGVAGPEMKIQALGVRGVRNIPIEEYKKMSWEERKRILASFRFLGAKQWSKTEAELASARKELEALMKRSLTDDEFMATQETYVGNKLLAQDLLRYIAEAELVTPGILNPRAAARNVPGGAVSREESKRTVLIIEDDPQYLRSLLREARVQGWTALTATTIQKARELWSQADAVMSDNDLPDGTGLELIKEMNPRGAATYKPVLLHTARWEQVDVKGTQLMREGRLAWFFRKGTLSNEDRFKSLARALDTAPFNDFFAFMAGKTLPGASNPAAIVVFGTDDLDVLREAAVAHQEHPSAKIVLSGGHGRLTAALIAAVRADETLSSALEGLSPSPTEAEVMAAVLRTLGVPGESLTLEDSSTNTRENAVNSLKAISLLPEGSEVLLISSPFHMLRAWLTADKAMKDDGHFLRSFRSGAPAFRTARMSGSLPGALNAALDELERIEEYGKKGDLTPIDRDSGTGGVPWIDRDDLDSVLNSLRSHLQGQVDQGKPEFRDALERVERLIASGAAPALDRIPPQVVRRTPAFSHWGVLVGPAKGMLIFGTTFLFSLTFLSWPVSLVVGIGALALVAWRSLRPLSLSPIPPVAGMSAIEALNLESLRPAASPLADLFGIPEPLRDMPSVEGGGELISRLYVFFHGAAMNEEDLTFLKARRDLDFASLEEIRGMLQDFRGLHEADPETGGENYGPQTARLMETAARAARENALSLGGISALIGTILVEREGYSGQKSGAAHRDAVMTLLRATASWERRPFNASAWARRARGEAPNAIVLELPALETPEEMELFARKVAEGVLRNEAVFFASTFGADRTAAKLREIQEIVRSRLAGRDLGTHGARSLRELPSRGINNLPITPLGLFDAGALYRRIQDLYPSFKGTTYNLLFSVLDLARWDRSTLPAGLRDFILFVVENLQVEGYTEKELEAVRILNYNA